MLRQLFKDYNSSQATLTNFKPVVFGHCMISKQATDIENKPRVAYEDSVP